MPHRALVAAGLATCLAAAAQASAQPVTPPEAEAFQTAFAPASTATAHAVHHIGWLPLESPLALDHTRLAAPPSNLHVPAALRDLVGDLWRRSPTFRRQCARVGADTGLTVIVSVGHWNASQWGGAKAHAELETNGNRRTARLELRATTDFARWLPHELEHVVEWIDGANYALARETLPTSRCTPGGHIETARAIRAEQQVAHELRCAPR